MKTKDVSYRIAYKSDHLGVIDLGGNVREWSISNRNNQ
jgi:hypothetical protein